MPRGDAALEGSLARAPAAALSRTARCSSAGGWQGGKRLYEDEDDAIWRAMLESNLETARVALQALLPGMVERRRGSIVAVGSRAAARPWESANAAAYAAAKAALVGLIKAAAAEVLNDGVRLNVVHPSTIDTAANRSAMPKADSSKWVSPESLSGVIAFLLSDAARDISGAEIPVYGRVRGLSYQYFSTLICPGLRWRCLRSPRASSSCRHVLNHRRVAAEHDVRARRIEGRARASFERAVGEGGGEAAVQHIACRWLAAHDGYPNETALVLGRKLGELVLVSRAAPLLARRAPPPAAQSAARISGERSIERNGPRPVPVANSHSSSASGT